MVGVGATGTVELASSVGGVVVAVTGGDTVVRQFRDIINYYKKASQGKIKDPKVKKIFDMLNSNINLVDNPEQ